MTFIEPAWLICRHIFKTSSFPPNLPKSVWENDCNYSDRATVRSLTPGATCSKNRPNLVKAEERGKGERRFSCLAPSTTHPLSLNKPLYLLRFCVPSVTWGQRCQKGCRKARVIHGLIVYRYSAIREYSMVILPWGCRVFWWGREGAHVHANFQHFRSREKKKKKSLHSPCI